MLPIALWGLLVPGAIGLFGGLIALRPGSVASTTPPRAAAALCLILAFAYASGHLGLPGAPAFGSGDVGRMILFFGAASGFVGAAVALYPIPLVIGWLLQAAVAAAYAWLLLGPKVEGGLTSSAAVSHVVVIGAAFVLVWEVVGRIARSEKGPGLALAILIWGAGGSVALVFSGSALLGQLAGILVAALGGVLLVLWRWPAPGRLAAIGPLIATIWVGQWSYALLYASMSWTVFVTLVVAGLTLLTPRVAPLERSSRLARLILPLAAVALAVSVSVGLAAQTYFADAPSAATPSSSSESRPAGPTSGGGSASPDDADYGY